MFNLPLNLPLHLNPQYPILPNQALDLPSDYQIFKETLENSFKHPLELLLKKIGKKSSKVTQIIAEPFNNPPILRKKANFELILANSIENSLCKSKYFNLKVILRPKGAEVLPMTETLQLEIMVFNKEGGTITRNMNGKEILRGKTVEPMTFYVMEMKHLAYFRIQITEVSSHFVNKKVDLVIKAKESEFLKMNGWTVKKLVLKNLTIKAKEIKNKELFS